VIRISDANRFFTSLGEKVQALNDTNPPHPLSAKLAAATLKRYLPDPGARIRLHDLVHDETERLVAQLTDSAFPAETTLPAATEIQQRVTRYNALTETLRSILITGCYWGDMMQIPTWVACLERVANANDPMSGLTYLVDLRRYPALVLFYAAGLGAVAAGRYDTLAALLTKPRVRDAHYERQPICLEVCPARVMETDIGRLLPRMKSRYTPVSDHLFALLYDSMREYKPAKDDYERTFDRFEYFLGLVHADIARRVYDNNKLIGPVGCFAWRGRHLPAQTGIRKEVQEELDATGENWPPLKAGLFGGSFEKAKEVKTKFDAHVDALGFL
jgi:hypothetical protein